MAPAGPSVSMDELLRWNDLTATRWAALLAAHPEALDLPCDIYGSGDVRGALRHIMAVELRYCDRLTGKPVTPYEQVPSGSVQELFDVHVGSVATFRTLLADETFNWEEAVEATTISAGKYQATKRVMLAHALLHGIRYYAQLATLVRQHGIKPDWQMDFIASAMTG
jgi:uncharacterized damage-inducible protein DinB